MPQLAAAGIGAAASIYAANKSEKAANNAANQITQSMDYPKLTGGGSMIRRVAVPASAGGGAYDRISIDPRIRAMREQGLQYLPGYRSEFQNAGNALSQGLGQVRGGYQDIIGQLDSNTNPFIQARVNPLLQRAAQARGDVVSSLSRRGLGGSSFYTQGLGNFESQIGQQIADQGALATQETLAAKQNALAGLGGIYGQEFAGKQAAISGQQSIDQAYSEIAQMNLQQELSSLGLNAQDIGAITNAAAMRLQGQQNALGILARGASGVGGALADYYKQKNALPSDLSPAYG